MGKASVSSPHREMQPGDEILMQARNISSSRHDREVSESRIELGSCLSFLSLLLVEAMENRFGTHISFPLNVHTGSV